MSHRIEVEKAANRIVLCTDRNAHTEALIIASKLFGLSDLEEKLTRMQRTHHSLGYLPDALYQERKQIRKKVMAHARPILNEAEFALLHAAF